MKIVFLKWLYVFMLVLFYRKCILVFLLWVLCFYKFVVVLILFKLLSCFLRKIIKFECGMIENDFYGLIGSGIIGGVVFFE